MGPSRLTAVYLKTISQAGVEAEMEAAGAAARSGGGVRVAGSRQRCSKTVFEGWKTSGRERSNVKILKM